MGFGAPEKCDDECIPHRAPSTPHLLFASLPFVLTFSVICIVVLHRLFPALCGAGSRRDLESRLRKRISAIAFSTTLGATGVLAELVLCEVSDWVDSDARQLAFRTVVSVLLVCLIAVIPLLELYSLVEGRWNRTRRTAVVIGGFTAWLWIFWTLGDKLPIRSEKMGLWATNSRTLSEECLARVGVVGVSLMALLSGFGCVSTPWHSFIAKQRQVSDADISRAQAGLDATTELLNGKRNKLRYIEKRMQERDSSQESLMTKMMSTLRGDPDSQEHAVLLKEVAGLETMRISLSSELAELQRHLAFQQYARSATGRILTTVYWGFSVYCIYRIAATTLAHLPLLGRSSSFSRSDPINNVLALLAAYWDPHLDRAAWSRQIGFLLSGVIIAGSFGSVMTTLKMVMRVAPAVKGDNHPNLALFFSQISAVYVLASALLLRSNLPPSMSTVITESLGAPLDPSFVDHWFDGLFLFAALLTAVALVAVRKLRAAWEPELDLESGTLTKQL